MQLKLTEADLDAHIIARDTPAANDPHAFDVSMWAPERATPWFWWIYAAGFFGALLLSHLFASA